MPALAIGKIPPSSLTKAVFPYLGHKSKRILIPPGIGRDAAAILYQNRVLVFSTDPITSPTSHIGTHSVVINANDIATTGARPTWYLCTLLLPPGMRESSLRRIMSEIHESAKSIGVSVIGGHSEVTPGLTRPIIAGFMVGETNERSLLRSDGAREGDRILLTKTSGLEGTAILASQYQNRLQGIPREVLRNAASFFNRMSIVGEALAAATMRGIHAMHDPTEGGVLNGLWEMAESSNLGIAVSAAKIPIAAETRQICSRLRLDPLKLMSSGSLLIAAGPAETPAIARRLMRMRVRVSEVARLTPKRTGRFVFREGGKTLLMAVPRDELYRLA